MVWVYLAAVAGVLVLLKAVVTIVLAMERFTERRVTSERANADLRSQLERYGR